MTTKATGDMMGFLAFPLYEMLDLPASTAFHVETVSSGTTALTLRVAVENEPSQRYFVKTLKAGSASGSHLKLGLREVRFYALIDQLTPAPYPPIPRCIHHRISPDERNYYLVLQDLSNTHQGYEQVDFSRLERWHVPLAALAAFHKRFTQRLMDNQIRAHADSPSQVEAYIHKLARAFQQFMADHRGLVGAPIFDLLADSIPVLRAIEIEKAQQVVQNKLTTILHRDAHVKNFLYPRSDGDQAVIVDWQFWGLGVGTFDLRHLLGSALKGQLRDHQEALVRFYYDRYMDGLEVDYTWEDCWLDYRQGIIDNLFMPVWQYAGFGWGVDRWGKTLEAAVENYYVLGCDRINL